MCCLTSFFHLLLICYSNNEGSHFLLLKRLFSCGCRLSAVEWWASLTGVMTSLHPVLASLVTEHLEDLDASPNLRLVVVK